jgi:transcriptional regulator with XRE-family HTH domain
MVTMPARRKKQHFQPTAIGRLIRAKREAADWSETELGNRLGLKGRAAVHGWEIGKTKQVPLALIHRLATVFSRAGIPTTQQELMKAMAVDIERDRELIASWDAGGVPEAGESA